jgi:3-oxoacyl-[acyl-carrier protein] reductase
MDLGIRGRVAVVSGGSRGIGAATARALAAEGCRVAITSRSAADIERVAAAIAEETGSQVLGVSGDMTVEDDVVRVVRTAVEHFGPVDIAVSNVIGHVIDAEKEGSGPGAGRFGSMPASAFREEYDRLLRSAWLLGREVVPDMRRRRWGRLVNIGSGVAREPATDLPHVLPNTVRAPVAGLLRAYAHRLAPYGVTANNALTGSILTERNEAYWTWLAKDTDRPRDELLAEVTAGIPLRRMGQPREQAGVIAFLCSERARHITGQSIPIDGGIHRHL